MIRGRGPVNRLTLLFVALFACVAASGSARAEDGYDLWLRYAPLEGAAKARLEAFDPAIKLADGAGQNESARIAREELQRGLESLLARPLNTAARNEIVLSCAATEPEAEGFSIDQADETALRKVVITATGPRGCLYGAFALLRELSQGRDLAGIAADEQPATPLRMINHWDNPDGHVERGYAGRSIFDWWHLPERLDPRMIDYARANASVGINGAVVNNVNARAFMLEPRYIAKLSRLADAWRPYGVRVYLSARFSAPQDIGGLETADPLDPAVRGWWQAKADEIYAAIPDFGGFLVKANSEGQPGPQDYGRTHADGANMLAAALEGRGNVIWRAFVYSAENEADRAKQAYEEFVPLDGKFADNVYVQVKNGPLDFQPREPFHPLFGAMPASKLVLEAQITREYLGQATGIAYLAPMWREVLQADTGRGGSVADIVAPAGIAGVANTGSARNWTGTHFDQANWYAFGRLAWNTQLRSEDIAREWAAQTFSRNEQFLGRVVPLMMRSREAKVDYMTPLGLAHLMATGHHYGPGPWVCDLARPDWNPCYYHRADKSGIGYDRTATGSDALAQYAPQVASQWATADTIDPAYLLWFHHVSWDAPMPSGRTLWEELVARYDRGVAEVDAMQAEWAGLRSFVDAERFESVSADLSIEAREARWWRDASIAYWQSVNGLPLPAGTRAPAETLDHYRSLSFPEAPGQ